MTARPIIRRYWREAALVTIILLPWLALLPLGLLWLWQNSVANWWFLPYDLTQADRPKARRIRDAIEHIGDILRIGCDRVVPISVRDVDAAYNIDLLWSLVATNLGEARIAKLERLQQDARGFSGARFLSQMAAGGRWLARSVWRGGS